MPVLTTSLPVLAKLSFDHSYSLCWSSPRIFKKNEMLEGPLRGSLPILYKKNRGGPDAALSWLSLRLMHSSCISFDTHWLVVLSCTCFAAPFPKDSLPKKKMMMMILTSGETSGEWRTVTSPLVMPSVHWCRFAILLVYRRWLSGLCVLLPFCNLSLVPCGSWYFLLTVATSRSSSTFAPERLIGIFWTTRRNFSRLLHLYSELQCTALTFVSYIGDCDHPVARACRGKKRMKVQVQGSMTIMGTKFHLKVADSARVVSEIKAWNWGFTKVSIKIACSMFSGEVWNSKILEVPSDVFVFIFHTFLFAAWFWNTKRNENTLQWRLCCPIWTIWIDTLLLLQVDKESLWNLSADGEWKRCQFDRCYQFSWSQRVISATS